MNLDPKTLTSGLIKLRKSSGHGTVIGRACSNLTEQIPQIPDYDRPEWATFEWQTLPGKIKEQMAILSRQSSPPHAEER